MTFLRISNPPTGLGAAAKVERAQNGNPHRVTGINWDMSENKKKEQELKDLVSKLQKAL
jgi:hypothetical protein